MTSPSRDRWTTRAAFILAAIGSAVGLGNIWRFPHVAYDGGGGAFLIPYFIALFTAGIPLLMLEFSLGHRMQGAAPVALGRVHPRLEFAGWWAVTGGMFITFYYTVIMAWVCFYIVDFTGALFTGELPWKEGMAGHYLESRVFTGSTETAAQAWVFTPLNWLAILFSGGLWLAIYFSIRRGVKSVGKVVWPTVLFPYVLLIILFFIAIQLEGAASGLSYYLSPDWSKFVNPDTGAPNLEGIAQVTSLAYGQIFFSLSIGFGIMIAYASFLPRTSDLKNSALITGLANSGTEFFAGFITFAVLGSLALSHGKFVGDVVGHSGFGLALVSYPTAIENIQWLGLPGQCLMGIAFFGCLLMVGYTSAFSLVEAMVAGICDKFDVSRKRVGIAFCVTGWLVSLCFCTPTGVTLLDAADHFLTNYGLLMVGLLQCIAVGWVLGPQSLRKHMNAVSEVKTSAYWDFCVKWLTPAILIFLLIFQLRSDIISKERSSTINLLGFGILLGGMVVALLLTLMRTSKENYLQRPEVNDDRQV